jgi:hypothetical protein
MQSFLFHLAVPVDEPSGDMPVLVHVMEEVATLLKVVVYVWELHVLANNPAKAIQSARDVV